MKKSNMYDWCVPWNPLAGECPHKCVYCSTKSFHWPSLKEKYSGELRLDEKALAKNLGKGNTWFVCAQNDLFAADVPDNCINDIITACQFYPGNTYVFQTKNPDRYFQWLWKLTGIVGEIILGCTIESNYNYEDDFSILISQAPGVVARMLAMEKLQGRKFITIEPILDFNLPVLRNWIKRINPEFVNIGADSKKHNLPEPSADKINALIAEIQKAGIEIREKHNLERLLK